MQRRAPRWFTETKAKENFAKWWPWGIGFAVAVLYGRNPEPFDDLASTAMTKARKPALRSTEWIERHDLDTEVAALELPPDQLFGPLSFEDQMRFALEALRTDNELGDGYIARLCIDNMDLSLDAPPQDDKLLKNGGKELLDFAIEDFTETRVGRKHKFFDADAFIRVVNLISNRRELALYFIEKGGIDLLFRALKTSTEVYGRLMVMRSLTLYCFQQPGDGEVERKILQGNHFRHIADAYREASGDPTETRYITMLLSSMMRHFPEAAAEQAHKHELPVLAVHNLNISRYKGVVHHLRILDDLRSLSNAKNSPLSTVDKQLYDAELVPVALGIVDVFPEYYESVHKLLHLLDDTRKNATPLDFVEYRVLNVLAKIHERYHNEGYYASDGTRDRVAGLLQWVLNDKECQRAFDPSVATNDLTQTLGRAQKVLDDCMARAV